MHLHPSPPCAARARATAPMQTTASSFRVPARHAHRAQRAQHAQHAQHDTRRRTHTSTAAAAAPPPPSPVDSEARGDPAVSGGAAAEAAPQVLAGRTVAVVGGGPGGVLCAAHLARLGAAVEVFESRDPAAVDRTKPPPPVWSIQLGLNAKKAVEGAGLSSDFGPQWRFEGSARHVPGKGTVFMGGWEGDERKVYDPSPNRLALATQRGIVAHLQAECERVYGDSVSMHYGMRAVGGDVCAGEVVLEDAAGELVARQFDMVVGADGTGSVVRKLMQEQDKQMKVSLRESASGMVCCLVDSPGHPATFATLETPSGEPFLGVPEGFEGSAGGCSFHFAFPSDTGPSSMGVCGVSVRFGGREVVLNISTDKKRLVQMRSAEEVEAALAAAYPQLPRLWQRQVAEMIQDKAVDEGLRLRSSTFVMCNKLASGRALLLGDAAHSVSPNIGAGCTAALQDSHILSRACIAASGDVAAAAQRYNAERLEDARTLTQVSKGIDAVGNFKFHRNLLVAAAGLPYYQARSSVQRSASGPLAGFLKTNFRMDAILQGSDTFADIRNGMRAYITRLVALAAAALAVTAAVAWKAFTLLPL